MRYNVHDGKQKNVVDFYPKNYLIGTLKTIVHGLRKPNYHLQIFPLLLKALHGGEVLALSNASYLQGLMEQFDGDIIWYRKFDCGQAFTIGFLEQLRETPVDEPPNPLPEPTGGANYTFGPVTHGSGYGPTEE